MLCSKKINQRLQYEYLIKICSFIIKNKKKTFSTFLPFYLQQIFSYKNKLRNKINNNDHTTLTTSFCKPSTTILLCFSPRFPPMPPSGSRNTSSGCHAGCANSFRFPLLSLKSLSANSPKLRVFPCRAKTWN